jgi:hypothetical protein
MDFMAGGLGTGAIPNYIQANGRMDAERLRPYVAENGKAYISVFNGGDREDPKCYSAIQVNNAVLRPDEWKQLDTALVEVKRERLTGFDYIVGKGLVKTLPNAMGTTVLEWHSISDSQEAIMTMDAVTRGQGDRVEYKQHFLPIPIMSVDYEINSRVLTVSRNMGNGLDVEEARNAARRIREMKEGLLFTDPATPYTFGGGTIYSFLNLPDRGTYTIPITWTTATGPQILADVVAMKNVAIADLHFGPWTLFIPTAYNAALDEDYSVSGNSLMTIRERLLKLDGLTDIVTVDVLPADNVVMAEMTTGTVEIINGLPLQNIQWSTEGGMVFKYKAMEIAVPRLKVDYNGNTGVVHGSV